MAGIFEAYDIRGLYPEEINADIVKKIGFAFAQFLGKGQIVIGHDMREASLGLSSAFAEGATSFGTDVVDVGLSTTPMLYYAIVDGGYDGGAMITASHLPSQYNGIKLCREKAIPLSGEAGLPEVEELTGQIGELPPEQGDYTRIDFLGHYVDKLTEFMEHPKPLKIVVDAGNGMGGLDTPRLFGRLPEYEFIPMYMEADGHFPNHVPNPVLPSTTEELQERVVAEQADLGIAFDGDCDRCGFVDENGERISADLIIAVLAEYFLQKEPGATILYDLRASRAVPERIAELGGKPVKTRVGHSFIKRKMREENAIFAGELSGHYYYRELGFIDSGILSMISMLNLLALKETPISQLVQPLSKYAQSGEINIQVSDKQKLLEVVEAAYSGGKQEHLDGLTVEYASWWFNLRESHTESVVRLVMEANNEATLQREQRKLLELINKNTRNTGGGNHE
jgi:phosphomannomutase